MSYSTVDGSVVIDVDMDVSDAEKELARLKGRVFKLENEIGEKESRRNDLVERQRRINAEINELQKSRNTLDGDAFADTSAVDEKISNMRGEVSTINKEINTIDSSLDTLNSTLDYTKMRFGEVSEISGSFAKEFDTNTISGQLEQANYELAQISAQGKGLGSQEYDEAYRKLALLTEQAREYQRELAKTPEKRQKEADAAMAAQEAERRLIDLKENAAVSDQHIVDLNEELVRLKERQAELHQAGVGLGHQEYDKTLQEIAAINNELKAYQNGLIEVEGRTDDVGDAQKRAAKHAGNLTGRLKGILASAFVFNVLSSGLRQFTGWVGKAIKSNKEASAAIAKLKGALLTLAQPLVEIIIPAFITLVNVLSRVVSAIASIVSQLFGSTIQSSQEAAKGLYSEMEALEGVGSAAKDAGKQMASFDEINQISDNGSSGSGGGGTGSGAAPDFDSSFIEGELERISFLVGGALLAVGAILTFSGINVPLGIALMAAGTLTLTSAITTNWGAIAEMLQGPIGAVVAVLSVAFLVIGAILAFSGINIPLGIGLIAIGALGLATALAANWDTVQEALQGPIGAVVGIVSAALLALGAILLFTGAGIPLGLGLIAIGALGLATAFAANWDTVQEALGGPIGAVVALVSGALLVLGVILLFTGVGIPLGLGLIAVGAAGLAATIIPNWDFILDAIKGAWESVKSFWNTHIAKFFTLDYWGDLGKGIIDGFLGGLKKAWETVVSWATGVVDWFAGLFKGAEKSVSGVTSASSGSSSGTRQYNVSTNGRSAFPSRASISLPQIPRLAQGAVIPPNREFMAVLGDQRRGVNIEAPLDMLVQAFNQANRETGGIAQIVALLQAILAAVKAGQVMEVDRRQFGQVVRQAYNEESRRVGVNFAGG